MKKVIYAVPPLKDPKGYATVGQNRQMQWFQAPTFVYPIVPALFVTMLQQKGHQTMWVDSVAEELNEVEFGQILVQQTPDYLVFECPTPLISRYMYIIDGIKHNMPDVKIVLVGEHASAFPEEMKQKVDFVATGGKWHLEVFKKIHGEEWEGKLPIIDRNLSRWWLYAYKNGNFKYLPATYIQASQDCWYGKCRFCSWAEYHKECTTRPVEDVLNEIEMLIRLGFKEIFDDSGTFPTGKWLRDFCNEVIARGYNNYVDFGCNMRFGALSKDDFLLMRKAGFRMVLWGLESVNQKTLDWLDKGTNLQDIKQDLIWAKAAGLESHLTVMFGFPNETLEEAKRTRDMVKFWLLNGFASSAQATICIPYPITPLWKECKEKGLLTTEDWDEYDMTRPIMKVPYDEKELFKLQKSIYNIAFHPKFLFRKLMKIRSWNDVKYYFRIFNKLYDRFGRMYETGKVMKG